MRLIGFVLILAGSFVVLRPGKHNTPTPTSGADPRVAVDTALAPAVRARLPHARLLTGTSDELIAKVRTGDTVVDLVILAPRQVALLASSERCSSPQPVAERGSARFVACLMNADGSSRALAAKALTAITDLEGRDALLAAGFDVPEARPTARTPSAGITPPPATSP